MPVETRAGHWRRPADMDAAHTRIQDILDRWPFLRPGPEAVHVIGDPAKSLSERGDRDDAALEDEVRSIGFTYLVF